MTSRPPAPEGPAAGVDLPGRAGLVRRLAVDLTPLRESPEYRRLWVGQSVSFVGTQMTAVAVSLQVYEITRSSAAVGLVGLVALVPLIGLGLVGGALADTVERRRLVLCTSTVLAALSVLLVVQALAGSRSVLLLYALVGLQSAAFAVDSPTRSTFPPRLLPVSQLPAANALAQITFGFGATVGPLVGALLVAHGGYGLAYGADVLTFVAALAGLAGLRPMPPQRDTAGRASVREGLTFLRSRPVLLSTFVADLLAMTFGMSRAVFPQLADTVLGGGATTVGYLNAALAAGALVASVLSGPAGRVRRQGVAIIAAIAGWGLAIVGFGLSRTLWVALVFLALAGAADALSAVWRNAVLQVSTPDEYRGRLNGVFLVVVAGGPRLGDMRVGGATALLGTTVAVTGGGAVVVAGVLVLGLLVPRLTTYVRPADEPDGAD